ncbi:MAG: alpha/beta hydrolase [Chloroflexota bacterium]|nr:alpha/beta hydrolase [Chloroflexota bacterium]
MNSKPSIAPLEQNIEVNGLTLHYCTWGNLTDSAGVVVLIHGLTSHHRAWAEFGPILAEQGWFVIAPDLRGRGGSAKPAHGYGLPFHVNDLLSLYDALSISKVHLVGHSLGALIALFHAAFQPERTGKIVLVDAGGKIPEDTLQAIGVTLSRLGQVYPSLEVYLDTFRQSPVFNWNAFWEDYMSYDLELRPDGTVISAVPKAAIMEEIGVNASIRTDILPNYIKAPTLLVRATEGLLGLNRGLVLPIEEAERLQSIIPGSRIVPIPEANHYTLILSDVFKQEVSAFLAETI